MRPSFIKAASPFFDHYSGLGQAVEYLSIQAFLPEYTVKTFATAVLPRLTWLNIGQSTLFETHQDLFGANIPAFENVANLDQLPAKGAIVIALPMKIEGGSGGPLRMIAVVP